MPRSIVHVHSPTFGHGFVLRDQVSKFTTPLRVVPQIVFHFDDLEVYLDDELGDLQWGQDVDGHRLRKLVGEEWHYLKCDVRLIKASGVSWRREKEQ